jgi:hypothetical protein
MPRSLGSSAASGQEIQVVAYFIELSSYSISFGEKEEGTVGNINRRACCDDPWPRR